MAKTNSNTSKESKKVTNSRLSAKTKAPKEGHNSGKSDRRSVIGRKINSWKQTIRARRAKHVHLHKSFKRSYREDYLRQTSTPGLLSHAMITFKTIFRHWRTSLPFIALMVFLYIFAVGLMSEDFYKQFQDSIDETSSELATGQIGNFAKASLLLISTVTSGGLDAGMGESQTIFMLILFLVMWLVTIFLLRHFLAGEKPRLRDGLYNALAPLLSTLLVFIVIFIQSIPIMLVIITYSAAVLTNFLATPFYALVYFIFAALMLLLSGYLLSSSIMALVAVTAPGVYPITALFAASDLMAGRRLKMVLRLIYLIFVVAMTYIITMLPIILLDLWFKGMWEWIAGWPIVPFFLLVVTCFVFMYATTYLYLYYRWLLDYKEK